MCNKHEDLYVDMLRKVRLTILSDELCSKFGVVEELDDIKMVVNTRKELCGAFINTMNVTFVNYTQISQKAPKSYSGYSDEYDMTHTNENLLQSSF